MKFFGLLLLLSVVAYCQGKPQATQVETKAFNDNLVKILEQLREMGRTGNEELGVPVLEPLELEEFEFAVNQDVATLNGKFSDLYVAGLTDFVINSVSFSLIGVQFDYQLTWPTVPFKTGYTADGIIGGVIPVYGTGEMQGELKNLVVTGNIGLSIKDSYLYIRSINTNVALEDFNFKITGLLDNEEFSEVISAVASDIVPQLMVDFETQIETILNNLITGVGNQVLGTMTLAELIALVMG